MTFKQSLAIASLAVLAAVPLAHARRAAPGTIRPAPAVPAEEAAAPGVSFYGIEANAQRVVFVVDHSGSMIDTFDFLREAIKKNLVSMAPTQRFSVIFFSEKVDDVFPKDGQLAQPTPEVKRELVNFVDNVRAAGKNDDALDPFVDGIKRALANKPNAIFLLTDGNPNAALAAKIKELNAEAKVQINTIAFIKISKEGEELLKTIAKDNGGKFIYVTEKDLGK